mmetsp:Transcript_55200/g.87664  ORF Transcript_55200/g.87664 Transcript_55200/m.87664 type:complete len:254 (-) Transcript_55200:71-832(-)
MTSARQTSPALQKLLATFSEANFDALLELVRIAETAERYEDMCDLVSRMVQIRFDTKKELSVEERNLLSVAYKNVVGSKRAAWRTLNGTFEDTDADMLSNYKKVVEKELESICQELIDLLRTKLIPSMGDQGDETKVFYLKMAADYYRYLSEFRSENQEYKDNAKKYYTDAMAVAESALAQTHPTRLGLALNFSVCYYEILKEPEKACDLAKKSFDAAIEQLDTLNDESYKDSTLIMQLLRDNLTLWTSEEED